LQKISAADFRSLDHVPPPLLAGKDAIRERKAYRSYRWAKGFHIKDPMPTIVSPAVYVGRPDSRLILPHISLPSPDFAGGCLWLLCFAQSSGTCSWSSSSALSRCTLIGTVKKLGVGTAVLLT
jgi:hypothetical protein